MKKNISNDTIFNMFKFLLKILVLAFLTIIPVSAGELDNALNKGKNVFLYLYTPKCKYCILFNPIYQQLTNNYSAEYTFVKINAETKEGQQLLYNFKVGYVPFVVLMNGKEKRYAQIPPPCLIDGNCVTTEMRYFKKK